MKIQKFYAGQIPANTDKTYAVVELHKKGIKIRYTDKLFEADKKELVIALTHKVKILVLPQIVVDVYNLHEENSISWTDAEEGFVDASIEGAVNLKTFIANASTIPAYSYKEENVSKKKIKNLHYGKFSVGSAFFSGKKMEVEFSSGEKNYIRFIPVNGQKKNVVSLDEVKEIYGRNLLGYPYQTIRYYAEVKCTNSLQIPVSLVRKWDIDTEDKVEVCVMNDGSIIASPMERTCAVDGEKIKPIKEKIVKKNVCKNCAEESDGEIKEIVSLIKNMIQMCSDIKEQNAALRGRVEFLEQQML